MAKISINNLIPGKRYRMVIEPQLQDGTVDGNASIVFTVPKAPVHAKTQKLKMQQGSYDAIVNGKIKKKPKLTLTIPDDIYDDLIWNNEVRDVIYIVYRTGATKKIALRQARKYISSGNSFSFSDISSSGHAIATPPTSWTFHPKSFTIKVNDTNFYSFEFAIARYVKDSSGAWSNRVWLQGNNIKDILSKETVWGK